MDSFNLDYSAASAQNGWTPASMRSPPVQFLGCSRCPVSVLCSPGYRPLN